MVGHLPPSPNLPPVTTTLVMGLEEGTSTPQKVVSLAGLRVYGVVVPSCGRGSRLGVYAQLPAYTQCACSPVE
jgi:hypothetical protein